MLVGAVFAGGLGYAITNWIVGVDSGSNGQAASGSVSNLTITATATPAAAGVLYPGGTGDVVVSIANPNPFPVTITAINLPTNTASATGYTTSALTIPQTGCLDSTPSGVTWSFATATRGTTHVLTTPLTVAASGDTNNPLAVTLLGAATMSTASPAACESTFFSMPSLAGIAATVGGSSITSSPATTGWTS